MDMNFSQIIKLQLMSQMGQNMSNPQSSGSFFHNIMSLMIVSVADDIGRYIPIACKEIKQYLVERCQRKIQHTVPLPRKTLIDDGIQLNTRHFLNSIMMKRHFDKSCESNGIVDSVLHHISKLNNVPMLKLINSGSMMISYIERPIQLNKDIFVNVKNLEIGPDDDVVSISMCLMSNTLSAAEISEYVNAVHQKYLEDTRNALLGKVYYFEQKSRDSDMPPPCMDIDHNHPSKVIEAKRMMIATAPKQLTFTMSPFYSNKTFSNVFGEKARQVEKRIEFFMENKNWYDEKGIPYQLGILLSGIPGSGKTSIVRAAANKTKRHIVNVNFSSIKTASQLKNLFFSNRLQVYTDASCCSHKSIYVPIDEILLVVDEIDTLGHIVKQRTSDASSEKQVEDELTLGDILTVLDGTMESPGRMIIMTTNHPEVLDKALIRPGRIDVHAHFGYAPRELIIDMYNALIEEKFPMDRVHELPHETLSAAEISQVLFTHIESKNVDNIIRDLREYRREHDLLLPKSVITKSEPGNKQEQHKSIVHNSDDAEQTTPNENINTMDHFDHDDAPKKMNKHLETSLFLNTHDRGGDAPTNEMGKRLKNVTAPRFHELHESIKQEGDGFMKTAHDNGVKFFDPMADDFSPVL